MEFAARNGYGKPLQNLKLTTPKYAAMRDRPHCTAFDSENFMDAEQLTVSQRGWNVRRPSSI